MQTNNAYVIAVAKRVNHSSWPDGFISYHFDGFIIFRVDDTGRSNLNFYK